MGELGYQLHTEWSSGLARALGFFDKIVNSGLACEPEESPAPLFAWFSITSEAWLNASRMATRGCLKWTK